MSVRSNRLAQAGRLLWLTTVVLIVLTALLVSAARLAAALAPDFRGHLEAAISDAIEQDVRIEDFRVRLRGMAFRAELSGVLIGTDEERPGLSLERVDLVLDLAGSLRTREPVIRELVIDRPDLSLLRDLGAEYSVVGMDPGEGLEVLLETLDGVLDDLLLRKMTVRVNEARVRYADRTRGEIRLLEGIDLRLVARPEGGRQLAAHVPLPADLGGELAFSAEWAGEAGVPLHEDVVRFYLRARGLQPALLAHAFARPGELPPVGVSGHLEIWGHLQGGIPGLGQSRPDSRRAADITLRAESGSVHLSRLFREPIPVDSLAAEARWRADGDGWQVDVDSFRVSNEDARADGLVRVAQRGAEPLFLDIRAAAEGVPGNAARTGRYLPVRIMPPRLVEWLDAAIVGGTARRAEVVFFGHAGGFPFDDGSGTFEVTADTGDVTLAFWPGWEPLSGVDGTLEFRQRGMRITADEGVIGGARLREAEARIDALGRSPLRITGSVTGAGEDLLGFLVGMPLTPPVVRDVVGEFRLDGDHGVDLGLEIPFDGRPVGVDGAVRLAGGRLDYPAGEIGLEGLSGIVHFDRFGLTAEAVEGRLGDAAVVLDLATSEQEEVGRIELVAAVTELPMAVIRDQFPALDFLTGSGDARVRLDFPAFTGKPPDPPVYLRVESNLAGIAGNLPAPADKEPQESLPLLVELPIGERPGILRFDVGDRIGGLLTWSPDGAPERLAIGLGSSASLPAEPGISITGRPERVDLDGWLRRETQADADVEARERMELQRLDLEIGALEVGGITMPEVALYGRRSGRDWRLHLDGPAIAGALDWRDGDVPVLDAQLRHLVIDPDDETALLSAGREPEAAGSPLAWPELRLSVNRLSLLGFDLGSLQVHTTREPSAYRLNEFRLEAPDLAFEAEGGWEDDAAGGTTSLAVRGSSDNVEAALARLGYADAIAGATGRSSAALSWAGSPADFDLAGLRGELRVSLRGGRVRPVDPGAGRVLGLLSVANIPRRLALNFTDVMEEGFTFDRILGEFDLADGIAEPRRLWLAGPSARIEAEGPINLLTREYDQTVTVLPRSSAAMPLIGGLIAGPPGAAALFLAQTVFSSQVDRMTRFEYRVTGPWQEPLIERIPRSTSVPENAVLPGMQTDGAN